MQELLASGAKMDLPNKSGASPLFIASQKNHIEVVKVKSNLQIHDSHILQELLANGANVDFQQKDGASPLYVASQNNHINVIKVRLAFTTDE